MTVATTGRFELREVEEPNLLDEMFDYSLPPKIEFDGAIHEEIDGRW